MLQEKWRENPVSNHEKIYRFFQKMILGHKFFRKLKTVKSVKQVKSFWETFVEIRLFPLLKSEC